MAQYDLTSTMASYLDRHLVFPLLEFLQMKKIYPQEELLRGKLVLLSKTNMLDYAGSIYKSLNKTEDIPPEMLAQRTEVVVKLKALQAACSSLTRILENEKDFNELTEKKLFTFYHLQEHFEVTYDAVDSLYDYAKMQFECGSYSNAATYLSVFRALTPNPEKSVQALWGKLASEILSQQWEVALSDLMQLKEIIDGPAGPNNRQNNQSSLPASSSTPLGLLQQRAWLIHWSLFVFFNHPNGRNGIIDMLFQERYLNTIQTACPHVLRYLTTAVITNKRRRNVLKDLVKVLQQESYTYRDPITEFLEMLYVSFDFEGAQEKLRQCELLLKNDFFLVACGDEFIENARLFIFETYCRIHQKIDIPMLATKLNMKHEHAERWIVNLIRNARLDAKIDSAQNQVVMGAQFPSVYQLVIEKTKGLSFRSHVLANTVSGGLKEKEERGGGGGGKRRNDRNDRNNNNNKEPSIEDDSVENTIAV
eukprot:TRINITY_DN4823_c0_g4_i1.p1 TRINITY_DN4823_c0_g4~~TRINITY_DN4823_c0_g4_i1.p1  ORF type:complete len:478 (-),score=110.46 TRINITY_DN4823_c0_g4_i1:67-1500(-)